MKTTLFTRLAACVAFAGAALAAGPANADSSWGVTVYGGSPYRGGYALTYHDSDYYRPHYYAPRYYRSGYYAPYRPVYRTIHRPYYRPYYRAAYRPARYYAPYYARPVRYDPYAPYVYRRW